MILAVEHSKSGKKLFLTEKTPDEILLHWSRGLGTVVNLQKRGVKKSDFRMILMAAFI
jgi:hypothetical protein